MFKLKISCKNHDILCLLLNNSGEMAKYFGKSAGELELSDVTEYLSIHSDEEIILKELY